MLNSVKIDLDIIEVDIRDSLGMICAEEVRAPFDIPLFDRSAVDGFAVRSFDVSSASQHNPVYLTIVGSLEAGSDLSGVRPLNDGEAYAVYTGAPMPPGADAVVPFEYCINEGSRVGVLRPVPPYGNVSRAGEDFRKGDVIVRRGVKLMPWHIAALASANVSRVKVYRRVRVAIMNTGNELINLGGGLRPGKIINSTGLLIESYVKLLNAEPIPLGIIPDDVESIRGAVVKSLSMSDIVVITGGTSIGDTDLVPEALESISGAIRLFHGVAIRPGRTAGAYIIGGKPVLIISGLPVACLVSLEVFLKPLIHFLTGEDELPLATVKAILTRRLVNEVGFKSFYRVSVCYGDDGKIYAEPLRLTGSGILSTLIRGNGIIVIPEEVEGFDVGEEISVQILNPISKCNSVYHIP